MECKDCGTEMEDRGGFCKESGNVLGESVTYYTIYQCPECKRVDFVED